MPRKNRTPIISRTPLTQQDCRDKRRFPSEKHAQAQAELQMLEQPDLSLGVYLCPQCTRWHLTSRPHNR